MEDFKNRWSVGGSGSLLALCGPLIFPNFLEISYCKGLIDFFLSEKDTGRVAQRTYQGSIQLERRNAEFVFLDVARQAQVSEMLCETVLRSLSIEPCIDSFQPGVIYRYPVGRGFELHHDAVTEEEERQARKSGAPIIGGDISCIIQLNDQLDFDGGELIFPRFGMHIALPIGSLAVYPANPNYPHEVTPIIRGERYTLVIRPVLSQGC